MGEQSTVTTGQAAMACRVSQRTVIRWIDSGFLPAYRFPGPGAHRRILHSDFLVFLEKNKIPVPADFRHSAPRILIVEDEAVIALQIQEILNAIDCETRIARNGFEAGRLIESFDPDVMTLDLNMPGIPGIGVLKTLRRGDRRRHIGVLIVSGMPRADLDEALALGANEVLVKPFQNDELVDRIKRLAGMDESSP